jgi:hypothetical protein
MFSEDDVGWRTDVVVAMKFSMLEDSPAVKAMQCLRKERPDAQIIFWPPNPDGKIPNGTVDWVKAQEDVFGSLSIASAVEEWVDTVAKVNCRKTVCGEATVEFVVGMFSATKMPVGCTGCLLPEHGPLDGHLCDVQVCKACNHGL